jgi:hypothetical protein
MGDTMEITSSDLDTLQTVHDLLIGSSTLLLGLASYDGIGTDSAPAIEIVARALETGAAALWRISEAADDPLGTGPSMNG